MALCTAIALRGALLLLSCAVAARAQDAAPPGGARIVAARVAATSDSGQTFALMLPRGYSPAKRWPVLFVFDPRGRALLGLERFADAADSLGYVIVSSYDSRSDSTPDVNVRAMNAMLSSVEDRLAIDTRRIYLAGFSGTARQIWEFALELRGNVAGLIGFGAGIPGVSDAVGTALGGEGGVSYFGGAGDDDFNYAETRSFAARLRRMNVAARIADYSGPHAWPPAEICGAALAWLHTRAMLTARIPMDSAFLGRRLAAGLARARALEDSARLARAADAYRAVAEDFGGWPEGRVAAGRAALLDANANVKTLRAREAVLARRDPDRAAAMERTMLLLRGSDRTATADELLERLGAPALRREAAGGDSLDAPAARRLLARLHTSLAFYEPRAQLARGAAREALVLLAAASRLAPLHGESCALLASARAAAPGAHADLACDGGASGRAVDSTGGSQDRP